MMFIVTSTILRGVCVENSLRHGAQADIAAVPRARFAVEKPHDLAKIGVDGVANLLDLGSNAL